MSPAASHTHSAAPLPGDCARLTVSPIKVGGPASSALDLPPSL